MFSMEIYVADTYMNFWSYGLRVKHLTALASSCGLELKSIAEASW